MNKDIENGIRLAINLWEIDTFAGIEPGMTTDEFKYELLNKANFWLERVKERYGNSDEIIDMFFKLLEQTTYEHLE